MPESDDYRYSVRHDSTEGACSQTQAGAADASAGGTGERRDNVPEIGGILRVGLPGDYRPFAFKDPESPSGYTGHDVELLEALGRTAGLIVVFLPTSWPSLEKDLLAGRLDAAAGGLTPTAARAECGRFLPPYAPFRKVALVRRNDAERFETPAALDMPDVRVVKNPGGTNEIWVDEHFRRAYVATCPVNEAIPGLIADGVGDVMITDAFEADWYVAHDRRLKAIFRGIEGEAALSPVQWKAVLVHETLKRTKHSTRPPLYERLLSAWECLEESGEIARLAKKWFRAGAVQNESASAENA